MTYLSQINSSATPPSSPAPAEADPDLAVFCGVICMFFAVNLVLWCTLETKKQQKKKILKTPPKLSYSEIVGEFSDCAICLTEFIDGDKLRVLPHCGHRFHVGCIDKWLVSSLTCPMCRHVVFKRGSVTVSPRRR